MAKIYTYKGKNLEELQKIDLNEFIKLIPARQRRSLSRGLTEQQKILLRKIQKNKGLKKSIKTHASDMIILPEMLGASLLIHNGKDWTRVDIIGEMIGHYLGEFRLTRKKVAHSAPGVGATRSSSGAASAK